MHSKNQKELQGDLMVKQKKGISLSISLSLSRPFSFIFLKCLILVQVKFSYFAKALILLPDTHSISDLYLAIYFYFIKGIIHLVRTQNFLQNYCLLPPGTDTYLFLPGGKNISFSENFA